MTTSTAPRTRISNASSGTASFRTSPPVAPRFLERSSDERFDFGVELLIAGLAERASRSLG
jgi:hypothetical protein